MPHYKSHSVRKILNQITFSEFKIDVLNNETKINHDKKIVILFDYEKNEAYDVTGEI